ncbi:MAG: hypothetical protein V3R52_03755 [Candidatus Neomarinimicrobiota bacterium]
MDTDSMDTQGFLSSVEQWSAYPLVPYLTESKPILSIPIIFDK